MPKPAARMGDMTSHGGTITTGALRTMIDGAPAARLGDVHVCPNCGPNAIVTGSTMTIIEGQPAAGLGDSTACGATIVTGSLTTIIE